MIVKLGKGYVIAHYLDNKVIKLSGAYEWSIWLSLIRNCKPGTIYQFIKSMERFWIWSLYNDVNENEQFPFYLARYREALLNGYRITEKRFDSYLEDELDLVIKYENPKAKRTINKELNGIKSFMHYVDNSSLVENESFIDIIYEQKRSKKGFLSALEIKKSSSFLDTFGKRKEIIKPYRATANNSNQIKAFQHKSFDALLSISKPRERLLYLLMGACSARVGQAVNLTIYDIDFEKEEVWLIDPTSTRTDIYGHSRRKWLFSKYGINIERDKEHNDLSMQFKYPIPLEHEPLYWISDKYRKLFFENVHKYISEKAYIKEKLRDKPHPFLFVTRTGRRLKPRSILNTFKKHIRELNVMGHNIPDFGLHSLRHMFGVVMGEVYAKTNDENIINTTQEAMGLNSNISCLIYFKKHKIIKKEIDDLFNEG